MQKVIFSMKLVKLKILSLRTKAKNQFILGRREYNELLLLKIASSEAPSKKKNVLNMLSQMSAQLELQSSLGVNVTKKK